MEAIKKAPEELVLPTSANENNISTKLYIKKKVDARLKRYDDLCLIKDAVIGLLTTQLLICIRFFQVDDAITAVGIVIGMTWSITAVLYGIDRKAIK